MDPAHVAGELRLMLEIVRAAAPLHEQLAPAVQADIDKRESDEEILALTADLARYSSFTRQRLEALFSASLMTLSKAGITPSRMSPTHERLLKLVRDER